MRTWPDVSGLWLECHRGRRRQRSGGPPRGDQEFSDTADRPTLIIVRSHIAYGSPNKQDTHGAHGARLARKKSGSPRKPTAGRRTRNSWCLTRFSRTFAANMAAAARGAEEWEPLRGQYAKQFPELAKEST